MGNVFNQKSWDLLWFRMGALLPPHFTLVQRAYCEPHRHYHTHKHISACLSHLQAHSFLAQNIDAVEYAIWMHDVVYDTHRNDNEAQSAQLAAELLHVSHASVDHEVVRTMIMATKQHKSVEADDIGLVCDIDLSVLALEPYDYAQYVMAVRAEYAWVPDPLFQKNRALFLKEMLDKPSIYRHPRLAALWESRARENLQHELNRMSPTG